MEQGVRVREIEREDRGMRGAKRGKRPVEEEYKKGERY